MARRRLPGGVFDYIDGGAEDERTLPANQARLRPDHVPAAGPSRRRQRGPHAPLCSANRFPIRWYSPPPGSPASPIRRASSPSPAPPRRPSSPTRSRRSAPVPSKRCAWRATGRLWFQVYAWRDRGLVKEMLARAAASRYEALVLTVDTAVLGRREPRRSARLLAPAEHRARHHPRRRPPPRLDLGLRAVGTHTLRQRRRPGGRRRRHTRDPLGLHQHPVRLWPVMGRHRLAALGPGTDPSSSRASRPSRTPAWPLTPGSRPSPCPTTAAGSSTAPRPPSTWWPRSPMPWAAVRRSSATAASAAAATS